MTTHTQIYVAIHCKPRGGYSEYFVFAGPKALGPRSGRCGIALDAECIGAHLHFARAVRVAEDYLAAHPRARLILTPSQAAAVQRLHRQRIVIG